MTTAAVPTVIDVRIEGWFVPRIETEKDAEWSVVRSYCSTCGVRVTERTYARLVGDATKEDVRLRKEHARIDGEHFLEHLRIQHPERWGEGQGS